MYMCMIVHEWCLSVYMCACACVVFSVYMCARVGVVSRCVHVCLCMCGV